MIHPALVELRARLEDIGLVVVQDPDCLSVRLPYLCSVRIRYDDHRLSCDAFFGVVPRTRATMVKIFGTSILAVTGLMTAGITPLTVVIGFLVAASGAYDVIRTTVTENVITKVQMLWSMHGIGLRARSETGEMQSLRPGGTGMLPPRMPVTPNVASERDRAHLSKP